MHHVGWEAQNRRGASILYQTHLFFFTFLLLRCARTLPCTVPASSPAVFDLHLHLILLHFASPCSHFRELRYCYCIEHLFVLCGFGRVRLADLGLFVLLVLALPLRVRFWHHHATRGVFLSSLKWKNNMC